MAGKTGLLLWAVVSSAVLNANEGEILFRQNCAACHQIGKGRLIGPDLWNIHLEREENWLVGFIRSSKKMIEAGDPLAVKLFNEYNQIPMPDNIHLSDKDINQLLQYIAAMSLKTENKPIASSSPVSEKASSVEDPRTSFEKVNDKIAMLQQTGIVYSLLIICILAGSMTLFALWYYKKS